MRRTPRAKGFVDSSFRKPPPQTLSAGDPPFVRGYGAVLSSAGRKRLTHPAWTAVGAFAVVLLLGTVFLEHAETRARTAQRLEAQRVAAQTALEFERRLADTLTIARAAGVLWRTQGGEASLRSVLASAPAISCFELVGESRKANTSCGPDKAPLQDVSFRPLAPAANQHSGLGGEVAFVGTSMLVSLPLDTAAASERATAVYRIDLDALCREAGAQGDPNHRLVLYRRHASGRRAICGSPVLRGAAEPEHLETGYGTLLWEWAAVPRSGWYVHGLELTLLPLFLGLAGATAVHRWSTRRRDEAACALRDPLTHLPNRKLFIERANLALAQAQRNGYGAAVLFLDLDGFKPVNDRFGHYVGDRLLVGVARRLSSSLRSIDTVARFGGDEFLVVLSGPATRQSAEAVAAQMIEMLSRPFQMEGHEIEIGVSAGVSLFPEDGCEIGELVRKADQAMYHSKRSGGNRFSSVTGGRIRGSDRTDNGHRCPTMSPEEP